MTTKTELPFGLKQYIITLKESLPEVGLCQRMIKAKNKKSAWMKFSTQYFGVLKPDPKLWLVKELI